MTDNTERTPEGMHVITPEERYEIYNRELPQFKFQEIEGMILDDDEEVGDADDILTVENLGKFDYREYALQGLKGKERKEIAEWYDNLRKKNDSVRCEPYTGDEAGKFVDGTTLCATDVEKDYDEDAAALAQQIYLKMEKGEG